MGKKHNMESAREVFIQGGKELLEPQYTNYTTKMKFKCPCGNIAKQSLKDAVRGVLCMKCSSARSSKACRLSFEAVRDFFTQNGCELIAKEYRNAKQLLEYVCSCGRGAQINYNNFRSGKRCNACGNESSGDKRRHKYSFVKNTFEDAGCVLLSKTYKNGKERLDYICVCGENSVITFTSFNAGHRCEGCRVVKISGKNSPHYRHELTEEERLVGRNSWELRKWRKEVFLRDKYTCVTCKKRGGGMNAHHLYAYHAFPEKRTDINNGVTLCVGCHEKFHVELGYKNNTKEQFDLWTYANRTA